MHLPRLRGYSPAAVDLTLSLALVVHLLLLLATQALGWTGRRPALLRQVIFALAQLHPADLPAAAACPLQLRLPYWTLPP